MIHDYATILITIMTQRNKRRITALEVLSEIEKLDTMEFEDGSMTSSLGDGMAVGGLRYCSMDDKIRGSSMDDGKRDSSVDDGMGE